MSRRRRTGINAPVASQQKMAAAIAIAAAKEASAIRLWPSCGQLFPDTLPGLATQRPADGGALRPDGPAQHHLLGLSRLTGAKVNAFAKAHFGAGGAQPPAHPAR